MTAIIIAIVGNTITIEKDQYKKRRRKLYKNGAKRSRATTIAKFEEQYLFGGL